MKATATDVLIDTIHDWGVEVVFGLPGDGINGIMEALRKRRDKIRFVHVRHEESAAFMACGYAKYTRKLRVVSPLPDGGRLVPLQNDTGEWAPRRSQLFGQIQKVVPHLGVSWAGKSSTRS